MEVFAEKFDDIKILRFEVPGFEALSLEKKLFVYHLNQATLAGSDILWDQHGKYNLLLRDILEAIYQFEEEKDTDDWRQLEIYLKKNWFSSGPHHHYSNDKFVPGFSEVVFKKWLNNLKPGIGKLTNWHLEKEQLEIIEKLIFDKTFMAKQVDSRADVDVVKESANNFYEGITQKEVETFYADQKEKASDKRISFGLNSKLRKEDGEITEEVYCVSGKYGKALAEINQHLNEALKYAETEGQREVIKLLVSYYETGDLHLFDQMSIKWVNELNVDVDFINGFIETYGDPMDLKATWEGVVQLVDKEETEKAKIIAEHADWFEHNSPTDQEHKKETIQGVSLKAINAVILGGDCYPASPLGINLPNAEWIREAHGSKSVTLTNISNAHHKASLSSGFAEEFTLTSEEVALEKKYGSVSDNLHTHLHECIGHGSGKLLPGVTSDKLKNYASVIEEARADLCGLYFMYDEKMLELGLLPSLDAAKAHYNGYIRNGLLTQITRIKLGDNIEQAHMRNRQLIASWVYEAGKGKVVEKVKKDEKTFFKINDHKQLKVLFGGLLREIQRIKSEGDFKAAQNIVETYGVKIDKQLHQEVLERFKKLQVPPFTGFLNPNYQLVEENGSVKDVVVDYNTDYATQMLSYSKQYGFLNSH